MKSSQEMNDTVLHNHDLSDTLYEGASAGRFIDHYLEQYRIYLVSFNQLADRRHKSNEFFLGLNTAIMAILGYIETKQVTHSLLVFTVVPLIGIGICVAWYQMIRSFKMLNRAKFKVIHDIERKLPSRLFETEWELLGKGKDRKKYYPLSSIEKTIPVIFIVLYVFVLLFQITNLFN